MFTRYRMMERTKHENSNERLFNSVTRGARLFQEYLCSAYYVEQKMKMDWVENNQKAIKAEKYAGLLDAQSTGDGLANIGEKITILPPSIQGTPRWYTESFQGKNLAKD